MKIENVYLKPREVSWSSDHNTYWTELNELYSICKDTAA